MIEIPPSVAFALIGLGIMWVGFGVGEIIRAVGYYNYYSEPALDNKEASDD